jgi:hypothetical protein
LEYFIPVFIHVGAYYTLKTKYGIRILALNTNLYYTSDKVTTHMDDPADQFVWMENILQQSRRDHEKVNLIPHTLYSNFRFFNEKSPSVKCEFTLLLSPEQNYFTCRINNYSLKRF